MDILLDSHAAVWWADDPSLLDDGEVSAIGDESNTVWFSPASAWELAIKVRSGRLALDVGHLVDQLTRHGIRPGATLVAEMTIVVVRGGACDLDHGAPCLAVVC